MSALQEPAPTAPAAGETLLRGAYSLAANSVITGALGMAFWVVAARLYSSGTLGRDSALIAALMQLSTIAQLNLANVLVRFMPGNPRERRLLLGAYGVSTVTGLLLGAAFVLVAPTISADFGFLSSEPWVTAVFLAGVALWGLFALQDAALTAVRAAPWVPVKNGAFGALKLAALPLLLAVGITHGPLLAWVVPMILLLVPVNLLLLRRVRARLTGRAVAGPRAAPLPRVGRFLALDYLSTLFFQTSLTVLPLIVVGVLGSSANAHFYIAFTVATAVDATFHSMAMPLVAEGAAAPERVPALLRLLVRRVAVVVVPLVALLIAAAPLVLLPFGAEYARESTDLLRILLVATLFRSSLVLAAAVWRIEGAAGRIALVDGVLLAGLVAMAIPLAHGVGTTGVALAWLLSAAAVGAVVLPGLVKRYRAGAAPG